MESDMAAIAGAMSEGALRRTQLKSSLRAHTSRCSTSANERCAFDDDDDDDDDDGGGGDEHSVMASVGARSSGAYATDE